MAGVIPSYRTASNYAPGLTKARVQKMALKGLLGHGGTLAALDLLVARVLLLSPTELMTLDDQRSVAQRVRTLVLDRQISFSTLMAFTYTGEGDTAGIRPIVAIDSADLEERIGGELAAMVRLPVGRWWDQLKLSDLDDSVFPAGTDRGGNGTRPALVDPGNHPGLEGDAMTG